MRLSLDTDPSDKMDMDKENKKRRLSSEGVDESEAKVYGHFYCIMLGYCSIGHLVKSVLFSFTSTCNGAMHIILYFDRNF